MPGEELEAGTDLVAEGLGDAEDDPPGKRPPQRPKPADDHCLEGRDELGWAVDRPERRPDPEEDAADRDCPERDRHCHGEEVAIIDPDEPSGPLVVRHGPQGAPELG